MGSPQDSVKISGTIEYMAPEVITRRGHSTAADFWSLGVLMVFSISLGRFTHLSRFPVRNVDWTLAVPRKRSQGHYAADFEVSCVLVNYKHNVKIFGV